MQAPETTYQDYLDSIAAKGPRCGCQDSANLGESKWGLSVVSWGVASFPTGLSQDRVIAIYEQAFAQWSAVCGLKFQRVTSKPNIVIGAGRGSRSNFDGPNGTLAWAYLPSGSRFTGQLEVRFDLDESWIDNPQARGILLLNVACHEFGHAIGLSHNSVKNNLLNPYYSPGISKPQREDIRQVVELYGPPTTAPTEPTTPTNPNVPVSAVKAVKVQLADGRVFGAAGNSPLAEIPANAMTGQEWSF